MSTRRPAETVEKALSLAKADATAVIVDFDDQVNLRFANNTLTTNGAMRSHHVTVVSVIGRSVGVHSASAPDDAALAELVARAEAVAREQEPAEDYADLLGADTAAAVDPDFTDDEGHTSAAVFSTFAKDLGSAFEQARGDGTLLYGFAEHAMSTTWVGTSTGLRRRHVQPKGSIEWTAKNGRPGGSVWHGQSTRDFVDVDVAGSVDVLRTRLRWTENQVSLPAGRYETIMSPSAVADMMIYLYWTASGRDADEGRTVFSRPGGGTRLGQALAPEGFTLRSDPGEPGLECTPFVVAHASSSFSSVFDNGLPLAPTAWIDDGKLAAFGETRAWATKVGRAVTPAIDNLVLDSPHGGSLDEMVAKTERGLLLTCLWYIREVDPETLLLTGLTRDGVYLVEKGEVVGGVNNFRFNESPVDLLGRITEASRTDRCLPREWADYFTWTRMPALRIPDYNMSSVSPAS
ncbi:MAG TPA: metallopeptidase TldD-related protein [Mycobacteriales bacterium]|nr:metallopeptidase TldD-related protein [Mycobacteriales bacterium]